MASVITMPRLSPTMEEGVLLKWTKNEGDKVNPGDVIAEIETDKANMEFPLEEEGTLLKQLVHEGDSVKLGAPVAVLGQPGEDVAGALAEAGAGGAASGEEGGETTVGQPAAKQATPPLPSGASAGAKKEEAQPPPPPEETQPAPPQEEAQPAPPQEAQPAPPPEAQPRGAAPSGNGHRRAGNGHRGGAVAAPSPPAAPATAPSETAPRASPLARKLAYERGIDLRSIAGSGPGGRVVKRDIEEAKARPAPAAQAPAPPAQPPAAARPLAPPTTPVSIPIAPGADQVVPLSPMRRTIARRLTESKATVPHFYVTMDARADALWAFHLQVKDTPGTKITINDLILRAAAVALRRVPEANVSWSEEGLVRHGGVHLGVAVSIQEGLVTPVIRDADRKSVGTIAAEALDLIERARARRLRADEFTGATFSVSNMGMLGVKSFSAVINPPESGILAVGAIEWRAVVLEEPEGAPDGGQGGRPRVEPRRMMTLTLSADHRALDGAVAARLLREIVTLLENPMSIVL